MLLFFFTKLSFTVFMVRCFFLLIRFLLVGDYGLSKSTSHFLSVPLTLECVRILFWSISFSFFFFNFLPDDVICKIAICGDDNALNWSCAKPSYLSQQAEMLWVAISSKKSKLLENISIFLQLHFDFKGSRFGT